ncbi:MAG: hypothetical protein ACJ757_17450 [Gaiellaceae bacterium]
MRDEANEDLRNLSSAALKFEVLKFLIRLERDPKVGRPLGLHGVGDLSDCRKIFFDDARHRIVYRLLPDEEAPVTADVIAIGPREALAVYINAVARLGRDV